MKLQQAISLGSLAGLSEEVPELLVITYHCLYPLNKYRHPMWSGQEMHSSGHLWSP